MGSRYHANRKKGKRELRPAASKVQEKESSKKVNVLNITLRKMDLGLRDVYERGRETTTKDEGGGKRERCKRHTQ